ncbi:(deoxy)nucleoside triphosphate pyrophosphohydrolase [Trichococcus sp. K1Tr]|uniref:(deoxy)nucleoside triphosphate pyrophosphohydrolase n=1 Tax=Trichococcus sp. K1Tr TaxID=3020847 RepID=UPI00232C9B40|nr:(deoxy)nucleoside triphosphate pyrophosphohydrolase [Trichococcus sp. K1Tr]MDB6353792.1 (deoxy)nucleoside triphosphate pyrophosphohydrolase [Trichococcus sp. K1Tr]
MIKVVGAVIEKEGSIFCAKRGPGKALAGLWEFPGGKLEENETAEEALVREMEEEFSCRILVKEELLTIQHLYDFGTVELTTLLCELNEGEPRLSEHTEMRWVNVSELPELDWAPADIPTVELLIQRL